MGYTSGFGIGCAARIAGSAASRRRRRSLGAGGRAGAAAGLWLLLAAASPIAQLDVGVEGLRSTAGVIRICLTTDAAHYPDCQGDPAARRLTVPARDARPIRFADVPSGTYAVALIHDENDNARLDTLFGVPREGVGFSRNPRPLFGAPRFARARFAIGNQRIDEQIRVRYFL